MAKYKAGDIVSLLNNYDTLCGLRILSGQLVIISFVDNNALDYYAEYSPNNGTPMRTVYLDKYWLDNNSILWGTSPVAATNSIPTAVGTIPTPLPPIATNSVGGRSSQTNSPNRNISRAHLRIFHTGDYFTLDAAYNFIHTRNNNDPLAGLPDPILIINYDYTKDTYYVRYTLASSIFLCHDDVCATSIETYATPCRAAPIGGLSQSGVGISPINSSKDEAKNVVQASGDCAHEWKLYQGIMDSYNYCIHCDMKDKNG